MNSMNSMNLDLELLESIEAPLSDEFWEGVCISVTVITAVVGLAVLVT